MADYAPTRILIFGQFGQVGSALCRQLAARSDVVVIATDVGDLDLTDRVATRDKVLVSRPDWVINTSAHTAVDKAESEEALAHTLNAEAPGVIASASAECGAGMVHYSTDYVFDGSATRPYQETDTPNPASAYGRTKLAGERAVAEAMPRHLVFRTAWVYSPEGKNFVNTMLRLAAERDTLRVVGDQVGSPTLAEDLAAATVAAVLQIRDRERETELPDPRYGLYHATGGGVTSWAEFAEAIMSISGNQQVSVESITTADYPTPAPRPAYSVLDNRKLESAFGLQLPEWRDALRRCLG